MATPLVVNVVPGPANVPPVANNDNASVPEDDAVVINVLSNDVDPDGGTLLPSTVTITQPPQHGTATVNPANGTITYTPSTNYDGPDSFRYTVTDNRGGVSNAALVSITVTDIPEPWHNKARPLDVDNDGVLSPVDAVLIINQINARGAGALPTPAPGNPPTEFVDVDGDNFLTPVDVQLVINAINAGVSVGGEGEPDELEMPIASRAEPLRNDAPALVEEAIQSAPASDLDEPLAAFWNDFATLTNATVSTMALPPAVVHDILAFWDWLGRHSATEKSTELAELDFEF
jgi:hypothetical protein